MLPSGPHSTPGMQWAGPAEKASTTKPSMLQDRALLLILLELAHLAARTDAYAHTPQSCFNIPGFALRLDEGAALWKIHCGGWCGICHGCGILWHTLAYSSILWDTLAYSGILWPSTHSKRNF